MIRNKNFILFDLKVDEYSNKGFLYLLLVYFGSLLVAAALAGPFFLKIQNCDCNICHYIVSKGIAKTFDRIRLIFIICSLPFFLKKCGIKSLVDIGFYHKDRDNIIHWAFIGIGCMLTVSVFEMLAGQYSFDVSKQTIFLAIIRLPKFILCALIVSILEEIIFRGVILRIFYTAFSHHIAILMSSLFFAYLHIKIPNNVQILDKNIGILSGFEYIFPMLFGFLYKFNVLEFIKITTLGIILSNLALKNFSLNKAIGFHTGIVLMMFVIKTLY